MGIFLEHLKDWAFLNQRFEDEMKMKIKIGNIISNSIMVMGLKEEGNQRWDRKRNIRNLYNFFTSSEFLGNKERTKNK